MKTVVRVAALLIGSSLLFACGGAKLGSKEAAAQALFYGSQGTSSAQGPQKGLPGIEQGIIGAEIQVQCTNGGSLYYQYEIDDVTMEMTFQLRYANCSFDGRNWVSGSMNYAMTADATNVALQMTGRLEFSGEIGDYIEFDITETVSATAFETGGTVSVTLNGFIETSTERYTYTNEVITFTAGTIEHS